MASADNFAIEERNAAKAIEWMNSYASKNRKKFETKLEGYILSTTNFGNIMEWRLVDSPKYHNKSKQEIESKGNRIRLSSKGRFFTVPISGK